jgi:hypothetical protein
VIRDDPMRDGQPEAGTGRFCGKKSIEDGRIASDETRPVILDLEDDVPRLPSRSQRDRGPVTVG